MTTELNCPRRALSLLAGIVLIAAAAPASAAEPKAEDIAWLNRVTFGINSEVVASYRELGRTRFLRQQLAGAGEPPPAIQRQIDTLEIAQRDGASLLNEAVAEQKRIATLPGAEQDGARKARGERGAAFVNQAVKRALLRALYSPSQLREQMVSFWLNHFSVFQGKGNVRWVVPDYAEQAIRPHVLGRFRDLVRATMMHPAMLQYLDNAQNGVGRLNENYARELLELHTLGVNGGYTQQDVEQLARVLTGFGVTTASDPPKLKKEWQPLYRRTGAFEFNPARHDFGEKTLLGQPIPGSGFDEAERALAIIISHPACARFISSRLATWFVADDPPAALVERMASTFTRTDGDISAVLEAMFSSKEFTRSLGGKFRDPTQYVIAAMRLAYDARPVVNVTPMHKWLNALGQAPFGRVSPDGYPLVASAWTSSGQMSRRFEIARAIGSSNAGFFQPDDGTEAQLTGFPQLSSRLYYEAIEPHLSANTRSALGRAASQVEWNTYLLASPELNYH